MGPLLFIETAIAGQYFVAAEVACLDCSDGDELVLAIALASGQHVMQYYFPGFYGSETVLLTCDINSPNTMAECTAILGGETALVVKLFRNQSYEDEKRVERQFAYSELELSYRHYFTLKISDSEGLTPLLYCYTRSNQASVWPVVPGLPVRNKTSQIRCRAFKNESLLSALESAAHVDLFNKSALDNYNRCELTDFTVLQYCDVRFLENGAAALRVLIRSSEKGAAGSHAVICTLFSLCLFQIIEFAFYVFQELKHHVTVSGRDGLALEKE